MRSFADGLFLQLLFIGLLLAVILLYNTLSLYKRKVTDSISLMLIFGVAMCIGEIVWAYTDGTPELKFLLCASVSVFMVAFVFFISYLNRFIMEQFGLLPSKKWLLVLIYHVPGIIMALLCVASFSNGACFWIDESGIAHEGDLFHSVFYYVLFAYLIAAIIPSAYYTLKGIRGDTDKFHTARSMLIFACLIPVIYLFELWTVGEAGEYYLALSTAVVTALVYLCTNVNTNLLMETQSRINAIEHDLMVASRIQTSALPPGSPEFSDHLELNLRATMNTAKDVGGDFYDYFVLDENRLCFLIADVSGKGTPAALFMMTAKTVIKDHAFMHKSTADIFTESNRRLCEDNDSGMFATAWIGILDTRTMKLLYTNAGHNYPVLQRKGRGAELLRKKHGLFLGGMDITKYKESELQLESGDRLLLYTDGVTEAHAPDDALYGEERLIEVMDRGAAGSGDELLSSIQENITSFADGTPQFDDITMMVLTIR